MDWFLTDGDGENDHLAHDTNVTEEVHEVHQPVVEELAQDTLGAFDDTAHNSALDIDIEEYHSQPADGLCVPYSLIGIADQFVGYDIPEAEFVAVAEANGLIAYNNDGTWSGMTLEDATKLLDLYGIPSHVEQGNIDTLIENLENGNKIVLAVDSDEIWYPMEGGGLMENQADHAIQLIGIDTSDPNNPIAIVNDPGQPDGQAWTLPLGLLEEAWADSGYSMLVTGPAPDGTAFDFISLISTPTEDVQSTAVDVQYESYTIQPGDTLWDLAIRFNTSIEELVELNDIENPDLIIAGEELKIPTN
ncbi:LysM peptidoglycan-binding domain-containing protein [Brevibacillus fluminis]|uniref:LysM peptidoglycan-binding domain-containing protein n=1 Tax=Brevibacillus fluminis TaxID=511487 RepID=UPI003F8ADCD0